jgi:hypothetical protein
MTQPLKSWNWVLIIGLLALLVIICGVLAHPYIQWVP